MKTKIHLYKFLWVMVLMSITLSGCIRMNEEIWINQDNSGKVSFTIGASEQLLAFSQTGSMQDLLGSKMPEGFSQELNSTNPLVKDFSVKEESKDGYKYVIYTAEVTDLQKILQTAGNDSITITKLDNGNMLFKQVIPVSNDTAALSDNLSSSMVKAAMAGNYWKVIVHVKGVVKTNGIIDQEANTVEWSIPVYDLAFANEPTELTIEYKAPISRYIYIIIAIVVFVILLAIAILLVIGGIVIFRRAQKKS